ncbi:MAG TPA: glycosyltransferase [Acidimicrobiia bacterium]|nr:glycosyltransferase [Acidimicrobiia bacterium]
MILQVLPSISLYDAISQHVLRIDDELKQRNIESSIVAQYIHPDFAHRVQSHSSIDSFDGHHVLYHMSMASSLAEKVHSSHARVDMWYHNVTPARYFEPWEPYVSLELRIARYQLSQLAVRVERGVAASHYSERELKTEGCRHTSVMPVLFDLSTKLSATSRSPSSQSARARILSVGRYAPHKRVEKLIQTLALYRNLVDENAVLELVGSSSSRWYKESLEKLIEQLGLANAVRFHDNIDDAHLAQLYHESDVYLCLSEHEGFCVPLVEAQCAGLPIVAIDSAAIAETVQGAGIILDAHCDLVDVVAALDIVIHDEQTRTFLQHNAKNNLVTRDIDEQARKAVEWLVAGDRQ